MMLHFYEIHPSVVHSPLALFPAAFACDAFGMLQKDDALFAAGRLLIFATALRAVTVALAALVEHRGADVKNEIEDRQIRHRNVNVGLAILLSLLARQRQRRKRPSASYMLAAAGGLAAMTYTAYLRATMAN